MDVRKLNHVVRIATMALQMINGDDYRNGTDCGGNSHLKGVTG